MIYLKHRAGGQQLAPGDALLVEVVQEDRLIGEGIRGVPGQIIEGEQVLIEKARWTGGGHDVLCPDSLDIT